MAIGMFLFATVDTQAKFLTEIYHPVQIVWVRQVGLLAGVIVLLLMRGVKILQTDHKKLQILRGTFAAISPLCFVMAISFVPLVDAMAVGFIAPFIVTILGPHGSRNVLVFIAGVRSLSASSAHLLSSDPVLAQYIRRFSLFLLRPLYLPPDKSCPAISAKPTPHQQPWHIPHLLEASG